MSDFFKNYSTFYYNIDKVKPIRGKLATNILSRVTIVNKVLNNVRSYYTHRIKEGERPDTIAEDYYNDGNLVFGETMTGSLAEIRTWKYPLSASIFKQQRIQCSSFKLWP